MGRWTQQDPVAGSLGNLGSADRYAYASDNPVNLVDPSGKAPSNLTACIVAVAASIATAVAGAIQTSWAVSILASPALTAAAGGVEAVIVNSLLPGIALIIGGLILGYFLAMITLCVSSRG